MPFKGKLRMEHIEGTEMYKLITPLIYITWEGIEREMEEGFPSDGHSYPKPLRSFTGSPFAIKWPRPGWYHDWLLDTLVALGLMTRREAASEYSHAMADDKAPVWKRKRNWLGVRIGDGLNWISKIFKKKEGVKKDEKTN